MKLLPKICFFFALALWSYSAAAQASMPRKGEKVTYRDGVGMKFGKMVEFKNGKEKPLSRTYTAANGTKLMPNGTVIYPGGNKEKLPDGYAVNKEGNKVILADDMIVPEKIREHQRKVTGKDATTITIREETRTTINEETGRKAVHDTIRTQTAE